VNRHWLLPSCAADERLQSFEEGLEGATKSRNGSPLALAVTSPPGGASASTIVSLQLPIAGASLRIIVVCKTFLLLFLFIHFYNLILLFFNTTSFINSCIIIVLKFDPASAVLIGGYQHSILGTSYLGQSAIPNANCTDLLNPVETVM